jgi:hypothetical protein
MKKFNEVITIEVSVDDIASKLLSCMSDTSKHNENIVESIIGGAVANNMTPLMTNLYNSLNGYTNDIDFAVGQIVVCSDKVTKYIKKESDGEEGFVREYLSIGECEVVEIDIHRTNKVKLSYTVFDREGKIRNESTWSRHTSCSHIPLVEHMDILEEQA